MYGLPDHGPSPVRLLVVAHGLTLDLLHTAVLEATVPGRAVGKARRLLDLGWHWRTLELWRAFPLAATAGRDGQPLPTGWK